MRIEKKYIIQGSLISISIIFILRLLFLQVISDEYKIAAENNTVQKHIEQPYRGEVYDRNNKLLVHNEPIYNLMITPKTAKNLNKKRFCQLFGISENELENSIIKAKRYSYVKPSIIIKNISHQKFAGVQDELSEFNGLSVYARIIRGYPTPTLANSIGYMSEIGPTKLNSDDEKYYDLGDLIGINGLEKSYEKYLRGKKGITYKLVDASGIEKGPFKGGKLDIPANPGENITTTIDLDLQLYCDKLMKNKKGSIVAIEPKTGEILSLASYPSYDPNFIKGENLKKNFIKLQQDQNSPLFNRAIMAMYPPGSIFKLIQALIALKENVINPYTTIPCNKNIVKCHNHPSPTNLHNALKYSCNPYFVYLFKKIINQNKSKNIYEDSRIGLENWQKSVMKFGLGKVLDIGIPNGKSGQVPGPDLYDRMYGKGRWKTSTIRSLDIGQGELLVTPIQMANIATIIANKGYHIRPHLVKKIDNKDLFYPKVETDIKKENYDRIIAAMAEATKGTCHRAYIKNITVCGKTGTAENPHGNDHSVFMGFAPKDDPKIAIAVYVENAGWGAQAATSIAGLVIEKYINKEVKRKWMEEYAMKEFSNVLS